MLEILVFRCRSTGKFYMHKNNIPRINQSFYTVIVLLDYGPIMHYHVGVSGFYIIVNLTQLCAFIGLNYSN